MMADDKDIGREEKTRQNASEQPAGGLQKKKRRVFRAPKKDTPAVKSGRTPVYPDTPVSEKSMARLAQLMNDSPTIVKLKGTEWEIKSLKPGAQWLIAEEACKVVKGENVAMGDVLKQFAINMPAVCRCLTIALLNDKAKIEGADYKRVYDTLMWGDYDMKDWATLLFEVINLVDVNFFFASTSAIQTVRTILNRKTKRTERQSSPPVQNGGK